MILVTGATGNIGRPLLERLHASGTAARALTRDASRASFPGGVEAVEGDINAPDTLRAALRGVTSLLLLSGVGPARDILAIARETGVEHVVLVSSITVLTHPHLPPAARAVDVERAVRDSGIASTILRPTQFATNTFLWTGPIRARRPVRAPYADIGLPTIDPADIAAVAHTALTDPTHRGHAYTLTGPAPVTPRQQVAALAAALGREIPLTEVTREEARRDLAPVLGEVVADAMLDLQGGDVTAALLKTHDTVERVTGTPGRTFAQWAAEHADAFR